MGEIKFMSYGAGQTVDVATLRAGIRRDAELVQEYAAELRRLATQMVESAARAEDILAKGGSLGNIPCLFASDLDMQASRVARRCDHMQALLEVAYTAEGDL